MPISLAIFGATGKMGKRVLSLAHQDKDFVVSSGCASRTSSHLGKDLGLLFSSSSLGILLEEDAGKASKKADLIIDFSTKDAFFENLQAAVEHLKPIVIGTTGLLEEAKKAIEMAAKKIPILYSPNFSFAVALCLEAAAKFARYFQNASIEIVETHHISKKDSPSGTAIAFANAMGGDIPIQSIRNQSAIGEHKIIFSSVEERIELKHEAMSRDAFAKGALIAAKFLMKKPAGLYGIKDIFSKEK